MRNGKREFRKNKKIQDLIVELISSQKKQSAHLIREWTRLGIRNKATSWAGRIVPFLGGTLNVCADCPRLHSVYHKPDRDGWLSGVWPCTGRYLYPNNLKAENVNIELLIWRRVILMEDIFFRNKLSDDIYRSIDTVIVGKWYMVLTLYDGLWNGGRIVVVNFHVFN